MTRHIGIDLGTACGIAWTDDLKPHALLSDVWSLKGGRFEGGGMRYERFRVLLEELIRKAPDERVFVWFEEVRRHIGTDAAHVYGGLLAMLGATCERLDVPYAGIPVGTIKKRATGKGNAGKPAMIEAANEAFHVEGPAITDDNVADAIWCLQCGLDQMGEK